MTERVHCLLRMASRDRGHYALITRLPQEAWATLYMSVGWMEGVKLHFAKREVVLSNGSVVRVFVTHQPEPLRGLSFDVAITDEYGPG